MAVAGPPTLQNLIRDYFLPAAPGETFTAILEVFCDQDQRTAAMVPILEANPVYVQFLLRMDLLRERIENWTVELVAEPNRERIMLERTLGLLGKTANRNIVAAIRQRRAAGVGLPRKVKDKYLLSPQDQLRYALHAEEFVQNRSMAFSDQAFLAGMLWDLLAALIAARGTSREAKKILDDSWKPAFRTARLAYALGSTLTKFPYERFVFGSGLLLHLGKVFMSILYPKELEAQSWNAFVTECDKLKLNSERAFNLREKSRFKISHNELAALYVGFSGHFRSTEKAIHFYREPYNLATHDRDLYLLASILCIAEGTTRGSSPLSTDSLNAVQLECLEALKISPDALKAQLAKIYAEAG